MRWLCVSVALLLSGCTSTIKGRGEVGVGSRTDYYVYSEARRSTDTASATLNVKALVDHLIEIGVVQPEDLDPALKEMLTAPSVLDADAGGG